MAIRWTQSQSNKKVSFIMYRDDVEKELRDRGLNFKERILYCKIISLCGRYGYCTASNQYLADFLDLSSPKDLNRYLIKLEEANLITRESEVKGTKTDRKIYPVLEWWLEEFEYTDSDEQDEE